MRNPNFTKTNVKPFYSPVQLNITHVSTRAWTTSSGLLNPERNLVFNFGSNSTYSEKLRANWFFKFGDEANNTPYDRYNSEQKHTGNISAGLPPRHYPCQKVTATQPSNAPKCTTLEAANWKIYFLNPCKPTPAPQTTAPANEPKSFLNISSHSPDSLERPPIWTSAYPKIASLPNPDARKFTAPTTLFLIFPRLHRPEYSLPIVYIPSRVPPLDFLHRWLEWSEFLQIFSQPCVVTSGDLSYNDRNTICFAGPTRRDGGPLNFSSKWDKFLCLYPSRAKPAPVLWTATIRNLDYPQTGICWHCHISVDKLQREIRSSTAAWLMAKVLRVLWIAMVWPVHLAQQYTTHSQKPTKFWTSKGDG